jgi:hypothetical protein
MLRSAYPTAERITARTVQHRRSIVSDVLFATRREMRKNLPGRLQTSIRRHPMDRGTQMGNPLELAAPLFIGSWRSANQRVAITAFIGG